MTQTANIVLSEWKVYIDGVEVPHQGVSISYEVDAPTTAQITIPPGRELLRFRPDSLIHVFSRDPYPEDQDSQLVDLYRLVWEGVSTGIQVQKTPNSRFVAISAVSLMGYLVNAQAFMVGFGIIPFTSIVTGATQLNITGNQGESLSGDILSISLLTNALTDPQMEGTDVPLRDKAVPHFGARIVRVIHEVASYNAFARQQVARSRLLDKIASVPDSMLDGVLNYKILNKFIKNVQSSIRDDSTMYDITRAMMSFGFHHMVEVPFPHRPENQSSNRGTHARLAKNAAEIPKQAIRNDFIVCPETYYTLPPPCNIILPDFIMDLSIQRNYTAEATRHLILEPTIGTVTVAPRRVRFPYENPKDFHGIVGTPDPEAVSAYGDEAKDKKGETNRLLAFTDRELEKGVMATQSVSDFQAFAASAYKRQKNIPPGNVSAQAASNNEVISSGKSLKGTEAMTSIANHQLTIKKYNRIGSCSLVGHHYVVPGFPAVICDQDMPHLANIQGVTLSVSPTGQETTSLRLTKVRPVPDIDDEQALSAIRSALTAAEQTVSEMERDLGALEEITPNDGLLARPATVKALAKKLSDGSEKLRSSMIKRVDAYIRLETVGNDSFTWVAMDVSEEDRSKALTLPLAVIDAVTGPTSHPYDPQLSAALQDTLKQIITEGNKVLDDIVSKISGPNVVTLQNEILNLTEVLSVLSETSQNVQGGEVDSLIQSLPDLLSSPEYDQSTALSSVAKKVVKTVIPEVYTVDETRSEVVLNFSAENIASDIQTVNETTSIYSNTEKYGTPHPGTAGGFLLTMQYAENLAKLYTDTMDSVEAMYKKIPTLEETDADEIETTKEHIVAQKSDAVFAALQQLEDAMDIPTPPPFFSEDLTNIAKLDTLYQDLLGCKQFYSAGPYANVETSSTSAILEALDKIASTAANQEVTEQATQLKKRVEFYYQYVGGLRSIAAVYPITGNKKMGPSPGRTWQEVVDQAGLTSSAQWAYNTLYRRSGTTMANFIVDNQLKLTTETSSSLVPYEFTVLSPEIYTRLVHNDGEVRYWDDTIFSKIVDENQFLTLEAEYKKRTTSADQIAPSATLGGISTSFLSEIVRDELTPKAEPDPFVEAARKQTTDKFLTSGPRQELILQYSKEQFGSRGHDGT